MKFRLFSVLLLLSSLLIIALTGVPVQSQVDCGETQGRTERTFYVAVQTQMAYTVYLPPCYDSTTNTYPVIYLMHGSNDDDGQWMRLGLGDILDAGITSGEIPPLIAVFPFGNWMANENEFDREGWGQVFMDEVMPRVEDTYRIDARRESRAMGGISRGGFWAFHIALRNPDLFSALGGHSAFFDQYHATAENNPLDLVTVPENTANLRIYLDRGGDDYAAPGLDLMDERLNEANVPHEYTVHPTGQHANSYWREHVAEYVQFYVQAWREAPVVRPTSSIFVTNTPANRVTPIIQPTETPAPTQVATETAENVSEAIRLYVPAVFFQSIESNVTAEMLANIRDGGADSRLILSVSNASALMADGVALSPDIRIVDDGALRNTLFSNRNLFTLLPFDQLNTNYRIMSIDDVHPIDMDLSTYPFAFMTGTPNFDRSRLTTLTMSGVTAITRGMIPALDANGLEWSVEAILPYVENTDYFHTSNEVSFYENCPQFNNDTLGGTTSFCSKPQHFELFNLLDVDIVELSGNHNNDFGYDLYRQSLAWFHENDIATIGGGETMAEARTPLILEHNGSRIAMLACNWVGPYYAIVNEDPTLTGGVRPGAAACSRAWLQPTLAQLSAENDLVIVSVQYQEVDEYTPPEDQQFDFRALADWGADVVIGTSSHFPQPVEFYGDAFIHYGLGNFLFDQQFFAGVHFFMDRLLIYDGVLVNVDLFTGIIEDQGRPRPMTAEERRNFLFLLFNEHSEF
ncbi:MAG: CapA family protein [Aggregatilineales bacterium]